MALRQLSRLEIAQNTFLPTLGEVQVIMFRTSLPGLHLTCKILWPWWRTGFPILLWKLGVFKARWQTEFQKG